MIFISVSIVMCPYHLFAPLTPSNLSNSMITPRRSFYKLIKTFFSPLILHLYACLLNFFHPTPSHHCRSVILLFLALSHYRYRGEGYGSETLHQYINVCFYIVQSINISA